jgi:hypothetical protein
LKHLPLTIHDHGVDKLRIECDTKPVYIIFGETMLDKIIRYSEKLTTDQLRRLKAHLEDVIRSRQERQSDREVIGEKTVGSTCFRLVGTRCGKKECKCLQGELHGPYWYAYFREDGKLRCKYVGKKLPDSAAMLKHSDALRKKAESARTKSQKRGESAKQALVSARLLSRQLASSVSPDTIKEPGSV